MRLAAVLLLMLMPGLGGCQWAPDGAQPAGKPGHAVVPAQWLPYRHVGTVVDLTVPRTGGWLTVAGYGHLLLLGWNGELKPFARGPDGYATGPGAESYLALVPGRPVPGARCSFAADTVFALQVRNSPGVIEVTRNGQGRPFARLPGVPSGIAFDDVGGFDHRVLVTSVINRHTRLFGIDCAGRITLIAARLPLMEGGITVAPSSFGAYGGDLIAPDERTGRIWAVNSHGRATLVARSRLSAGGDTGVESTGFIPRGFGPAWAAYVADRLEPGDPHAGTGYILRLSATVLLRAGARPGDLVVATEASAKTILVRCTTVCTAHQITEGPAITHTEGHIVFARLG